MKKSVIIFIAVIIIAGILFTNKNFIEQSKEYLNGLKGFLETSKPQNMSIFVLPAIPILTIISPENITYYSYSILLNYSAKNAEAIWYVLDNSENITITSPIYFIADQGSHTLYLYANNSQGTAMKDVTFSIIISVPPSGGNGGGGEAELPKEKQEECLSNWVCEEWTVCINSIQTRVCKDANFCSEEKTETRACEEKPISTPKTEEPGTKFLSEYFPIFICILLIILIILIIIIKKLIKKEFKRKSKKSRK